MFISEEIFQTYVDEVLQRAKAYIADNLGKTTSLNVEGNSEETRKAHAFLSLEQKTHPYDAPDVRAAIAFILRDRLQNAVSSEKPETVILTGSIVSPHLLMQGVEDPAITDENKQALVKLIAGKVVSAIPVFKKLFATQPTGIRTDTYAYSRPLMSGIDQILSKIASTHGISMCTFDGLDPQNKEAEESIRQKVERLSAAGKLTIVAMGLTDPEAEAAAQAFGMNANEARRSALNFRYFFPELKKIAANIIMVDSKFHTIVKQNNKQVAEADMAPEGSPWRAIFMPKPAHKGAEPA